MHRVQPLSGRVLELCTEADRLPRLDLLTGPAIDAALRRRLALFSPNDRQLMELALTGRHSQRQLGQLLGLNHGNISRRVARLRRRLEDPVVEALADHPQALSERYRRLGIEHFALGQSIRALCRHFELSREEVITILAYLRVWATMPKDLRRAQ